MIPKFSVKKPYTVIVGILLTIVLGVVSLTRMSSDLLPDMNLPYAIVITTYVGASPDSVESMVTIPLEETLATVSGISNLTSNSSENYSLVILEFTEGTNMDSVTVEMREKLDQLKASWNDDNIGSPLIMKINPDMAPVVVAAVDMDNRDQKQLTDFVNDNLIAKLESMGGVASVSAAGQIEAEVQVIVRQDKIDQLNGRITDILDDEFADAQRKLDDGAEELQDAEDELDDQKRSVSQQLAQGEDQVVSGKINAITTRAQLEQQLKDLESKKTELEGNLAQIAEAKSKKEELSQSIAMLEQVLAQAQEAEQERDKAAEELKELPTGDLPIGDLTSDDLLTGDLPAGALPIGDLNPSKEDAAEGDDMTEDGEDPLELPTEAPSGDGLDLELPTEAPSGDGLDLELPTESPIPTDPSQMTAAQRLVYYTTVLEGIKQQLSQRKIEVKEGEEVSAVLTAKLAEMNAASEELDKAINSEQTLIDTLAQIEAAIPQLNAALKKIESGEEQLSDALTEINSSGILASIELGSASAQLASAQSQLDSAQTQLDNAKESAYDSADADKILTVSTVTSLLTAQNFEMPAGYITEGEDSLLVRVGENINTLDELRELPLMDMGLDGLDTIRLSDVADVIVKDNSEEVYAKVNNNGAVILSILKQDGYSTGDVSKAVLARFDTLEQEYPGLHFSVLSDQGVYIDMVVHSVVQSMAYGAVLAVVVLFLFLKDLRPTMIIAVSIPVSVVLALVFMYMAKVTLNMMSLGGLSLGIGMLVDNSVVALENIYRYRSMGYNPWSAAVAGTKEVLGAIVASTLTTVCVFTGLLFTKGVVIDMLIALALSFSFALLGSLIIAMTFVPMMSSLLMRRERTIRHPLFERFVQGYGRFLNLCLNIKPIVILITLILLISTTTSILSRGFSFMPDMASTQASISLTTPADLSFSQTMEIADEVARRVSGITDVETVSVQSGSSGMMGTLLSSMFAGVGSGESDANAASFYVVFAEERTITNDEFIQQVEERCADLNCTLNVRANSMDLSALTGTGVTVRLYGKDKDQLTELAKALAQRLSTLEGVDSVDDGLTDSSDQLMVTVDKAQAVKHSLTVAQVFQTIASKIATPTAVTTLHLEEGSYALYVKKDSDSDMDRSQLEEIVFDPPQSSGMSASGAISGFDDDEDEEEEEPEEDILLRDVADFSTVLGMDTINRYNQQRYLSLTVNIQEDHNVTLVSNAIERSLDSYDFPDGYYVDYSGESESIMEAMGKLVEMLLLALVCIYLVMVAQFQSLLHPFIIMFTIPLAFTGGFMALLLADSEISVLAMIGFVLLSGVIVNNGIVMIDFINRLRLRGMSKREAIIEAGMTRMRPVLMTTLTTVFAQIFMAMGRSLGAILLRPMALVTVGGLTYGTLMTLIFVPCIYDVFTSDKRMESMEIDDTIIGE